MTPSLRTVLLLAVLCPSAAVVWAAPAALTATWQGSALQGLAVDGQSVPGVSASLQLLDPRTGKPADAGKFSVQASVTRRDGVLFLSGVVSATGQDDTVADLELRVEGVTIATTPGFDDPLLLPAELLNKLPVVSLRTVQSGEDQLALAIPATSLIIYEFRNLTAEKAVVLRCPLGFTAEAKPELRMRAPFSFVLYPTEPRWHFRSALAGYYRLFPGAFQRVEVGSGRPARDGGWFFANETKNIPDPQHFAFHEGDGSVEEDAARGMGLYPYSETSSETIVLPGPQMAKDYDDAMRQMDALDSQVTPAAWGLQGGALDETVKHGGQRAYRAALTDPRGTNWARQVAKPQSPLAGPVVISAWSKADNVSAGEPHDYSIYVDALGQDGAWQFGQCAVFQPGTHDWQRAEFAIQPKSPLVELRVYAMFRNHTGTAWFDDLSLAPQDRPGENLLRNGDFETLARREDIRFVRDNACRNAAGQLEFIITDNYGSDEPPDRPLSLLRFICNVDPDLRNPEDRLTPAQRTTAMYDTLFKNAPGLAGAYIDSCAAWCAWITNYQREHFRAADHPFTYDPKTFRVGTPGLFASYKWLRFIQDRYHPQGRTIFGNMGPTLAAWCDYTALDVIGIESSYFANPAMMAYHRWGGYHKPVLTMNYVNLHKLDQRPVAEEFVLASARFGHFPSTGRLVREGYASHGDVLHTYYPVLEEMSPAGWEPEPLVLGASAERFGRGEVVYLTLRAPEIGREVQLTVLAEALAGFAAGAGIKDPPVVMDAVQLAAVPSRAEGGNLSLTLSDGARELTILRIASASNTRQWLLHRAAAHCENAAIVRGLSANTKMLQDLATALRGLKPADRGRSAGDSGVGALVAALQAEEAKTAQEPDSLEKTSLLTELRDAQRALAEWLLLTGGATLDVQGTRVTPTSRPASLTVAFTPGRSGATCLGTWSAPGRNILRLVSVTPPATLTPPGQPVTIDAELPGAAHVLTALKLPVTGAKPITVVRALNVHFTPVLTAEVSKTVTADRKAYLYRVNLKRLAGAMPLKVEAQAAKVTVEPAAVDLDAEQTTAEFRVTADGRVTEVVPLTFRVRSARGRLLAETKADFWNIPPPGEGNLARASLGVKVTTDSCYSGYGSEVINDGVWEGPGLHWAQRAWASADRAGDEGHWVQLDLPKPTTVSQMWVYWNIEGDAVYSARDFEVQVWQGDQWQTVAAVKDAPVSTVSRLRWPAVTTSKVRLHQLSGGGAARRPNIMWVSEVCLY